MSTSVWAATGPSTIGLRKDDRKRSDYPQAAYYHRKKAGLTGTRQNPDRHWRKKQNPATVNDCGGVSIHNER